ncbi:MAG: hypothetical protein EOP04_30410 [Proteobacteria bacterium]|nr:MAG: hypothetical protein EOP04_30410 [Pseudomonadota bacterium]
MRRLLMVPFALLASQAWADLEFELGVGHRFTGSSGFDQFSGARESNSYASPVEQSRLKSLNEVSFRVFYPRTSSLQIGAAFDWMIPGSSETQVFPSQESAVKKTSRQRGWTVGPSFIYQLERFQESHTPLTLGFEPQLGLLVVQQDWQGSTNGALTAQALSYRFNLFYIRYWTH